MTQLLKPYSLVPKASEETTASVAVFYNGVGNNAWLVYEIARDFLSAPRLFMVLELTNTQMLALNSSVEYDGVEYLEDGNMADMGWFQIKPSPWAETGQQHLLLNMANERYELVCEELLPQARVYHQPNARAALLHWLSSN